MVSLPQAWSRRYEIEKNRELSIEEAEGSLKISPGSLTVKDSSIIIKIEDMNVDKIYYSVQSAYFKGFKKINLIGILSKTQFKVIERIQKMLSGLEVVEQTENSLTFSDVLEKESLDIDKNLNYIFSLLINMGSEIAEYIEHGEEPEDKITNMGHLCKRACNLVNRCCNIAIKDSNFLMKNQKTLHEIIIITRILKDLEMLIMHLEGLSFMINTKETEAMKQFHYPAFKKDPKVYKTIEENMKRWVTYFKQIQIATMKKDSEKAMDLYVKRFEEKMAKEDVQSRHMNYVITLIQMINRNTNSIIRDVSTL